MTPPRAAKAAVAEVSSLLASIETQEVPVIVLRSDAALWSALDAHTGGSEIVAMACGSRDGAGSARVLFLRYGLAPAALRLLLREVVSLDVNAWHADDSPVWLRAGDGTPKRVTL